MSVKPEWSMHDSFLVTREILGCTSSASYVATLLFFLNGASHWRDLLTQWWLPSIGLLLLFEICCSRCDRFYLMWFDPLRVSRLSLACTSFFLCVVTVVVSPPGAS